MATRPEFLLARQERARAAFGVQDALGGVDDAQAALADSLGIAPTALMRVADLSALSLPTGLADSVEQIIDRTLSRRPDLASRLAALRAREAEERRAGAEFWPRLLFSGSVGQAIQRYRVGPPFGRFTMNDTEYGAFLNFEWKLYNGLERDNALREARSLRGAAEADLSALELKAIREVWKAYSDVKRRCASSITRSICSRLPRRRTSRPWSVSFGGTGDGDRPAGGPTRPGSRQDH